MELSAKQKVLFFSTMMTFGELIGWLFYDSLLYGFVISLLLLSFDDEYKKHLLTKRKKELLLQFKDFLYSLSSSVTTGRSVRQGIIESYEFWKTSYDDNSYILKELKGFIDKMEKSNVEDIALLEDFGQRTGLEDINDFAMMCRVCKKKGGNLHSAIMKCSDIISEKISLEMELHTIMIQKKFEGYIIAIAPILMTGLMKVFTPSYLEPLTKTATGNLLSTIALGLIVGAWVIIGRVNRIEI